MMLRHTTCRAQTIVSKSITGSKEKSNESCNNKQHKKQRIEMPWNVKNVHEDNKNNGIGCIGRLDKGWGGMVKMAYGEDRKWNTSGPTQLIAGGLFYCPYPNLSSPVVWALGAFYFYEKSRYTISSGVCYDS